MNQMQIGKFIAELRKEKNMTQAELGEKIGVTNKTISRWENGNYMPDISVIQMLCATLDIGINELICGKRLNETNFKENAENNLMSTLTQVKNIRRQKQWIDFFGGSGTGFLLSVVYAPDSTRKLVVIVIGLSMIGISWYLKAKYDKYVMEQIEPKN